MEECHELYTSKVFLPRALILLIVIGIFVMAIHLKFSNVRQSDGRIRQKFGLFLVCATFWILCTSSWLNIEFRSLLEKAGDNPRFVLSFTTTAVDQIFPSLQAHLTQRGPISYDQIYVVIPESYNGKKTAIPKWLIGDNVKPEMNNSYAGNAYALLPSPVHEKIRLVVIEVDFGPASKLLGALLVEHDPNTIIAYGDDDRMPSPRFMERFYYYAMKYPSDSISANGGWIGTEGFLYCGRPLEVGTNEVSQLLGASFIVTRRKFYPDSVFDVNKYGKGCFFGDDFYLAHVLAVQGIKRRLVYDSCWVLPDQAFERTGLSGKKSLHPGGKNIENYQACFREVGDAISGSEFGRIPMFLFARIWGFARLFINAIKGDAVVPC